MTREQRIQRYRQMRAGIMCKVMEANAAISRAHDAKLEAEHKRQALDHDLFNLWRSAEEHGIKPGEIVG